MTPNEKRDAEIRAWVDSKPAIFKGTETLGWFVFLPTQLDAVREQAKERLEALRPFAKLSRQESFSTTTNTKISYRWIPILLEDCHKAKHLVDAEDKKGGDA